MTKIFIKNKKTRNISLMLIIFVLVVFVFSFFHNPASLATQWNINPTSVDISYVDVSDSNNTSGTTICAAYSQSTFGNNTDWDVRAGSCAGITVSGGCFTDAGEGTPCSDAGPEEIAVSVNGASPVTIDTTVSGSWSGTLTQPSNGDILTFFINGEATESEEATTVVKYDGSGDVTLVKMYQSMLVIGADSGSANSDQTITNSNMDPAGNGYDNTDDEDITYSYNAGSSTLTIDDDNNKTETLYIISGDTYQPDAASGETINTHHLYIEGVITADNNAFSVAGDWTNNGTFTDDTSTVTFNGAALQTITSGGSSFNNVIFNNSLVADPNINYTGALVVDSNVTLSNTTRIASTDNTLITISGAIDGANILTINSGSGAVTLGGIIGNTTPITSLASTGSGAVAINTTGITTRDVASNTVSFTGAVTLGAGLTINTDQTTNDGNITFSSTIDSSDDTDRALTLTAGSADITVSGTIGNANDLASLTIAGNDITLANIGGGSAGVTGATSITSTDAGDTGVLTLSGTVYNTNAATYVGGATDGISITGASAAFTTSADNITFTNTATLGNISAVSVTTSGSAPGSGDITFETIRGTSDEDITLDASSADVTVGLIGDETANEINTVAITGATITLNGNIYTSDAAGNTVTLTGAVALGAGVTIDTDNTTNDGTITFSSTTNGTHSLTLNAGAAQVTFNNNVGATQSIGLLTKQGSGDLLFGSSTLTCTGLTLSTGTINNAGTDSGAWTTTGDVTISNGTLKGTINTLTVGGSWDNNGTFTRGTGTVTFNASSGDKTINDNGSAFYNIKFDGTGATTSWTYTDEGTSVITNSTELTNNVDTNGTVTFINARTGANLTVTSGILNVDWYLGAHTVSAANPYPGINTLNDDDITISEADDALTVWKHNGASWGTPLASQTTGTDGTYKNPQPSTAGAIRIREYSKISTGTTYYKYNFKVDWQESYGQYDYFDDYGGNYLSSTLNTACTTNCDKVISGEDTTSAACTSQACRWHRTAPGTMTNPYTCSAGTGNTCINEPPNNGSWYVGMLTGLNFIIDDYTIDFGTITPGATPTNQTNTLTVTTSATDGYVIKAWAVEPSGFTAAMACSDAGSCGTEEIADWGGTNAIPTTWATGAGFGYSTNDTALLTGTADRFSGPKYAEFIHTGGGELVADRSGTECPCLNEANIITYRLGSSDIQRPGTYQATIIYILTAQY